MGGEGEVGYGGFGDWVERGWGEMYSIVIDRQVLNSPENLVYPMLLGVPYT